MVVEPVDYVHIPIKPCSSTYLLVWTIGLYRSRVVRDIHRQGRLRGLGEQFLSFVHGVLTLKAEVINKTLDASREVRILEDRALDPVTGVHHGGVISTAELFANSWKGGVGELARQVHGDLSWKRDPFRAPLGFHFFNPHAKELGHGPLDRGDGHRPDSCLWEEVAQDFGGEFDGQ